jgi:hypothetical protein
MFIASQFYFMAFSHQKQPASLPLRIHFQQNLFSIQIKNCMNRLLPLAATGIVLPVLILISACKHDTISGPATIKSWDNIEMKSIYEVPAPAGRTEEGEASLQLMSDNTLKYSFHLHNLSPSDALTAAHIHVGNAGVSGAIIIPLNPSFVGAGATGTVTLRQGQADTLRNMPVYINVHSTQVPSGLARGQIDQEIKFAMDIPLSGANERPTPITTTATGLAILRLMEDKTLYSIVNVNNVEANDTLTVAPCAQRHS